MWALLSLYTLVIHPIDVTAGFYRPTANPTFFSLSNTNNPPSTVANVYVAPPGFGYKPVTGKWQGNGASNATTKVGVFRPGTGGWYLDSGNQVVDACGTDYCFFLASCLYQPGDIPIAGDWDNDGIVSVGVYRPWTGTFYLSNVNPFNVRFNNTISTWDYIIQGGPPSFGYLPVVGDWTGMEGSKLGVFRPSSGGWYLDNGNLSFPGCSEDQCPTVFGQAGDRPVAFGKSIVKAN